MFITALKRNGKLICKFPEFIELSFNELFNHYTAIFKIVFNFCFFFASTMPVKVHHNTLNSGKQSVRPL